VCARIVRPASEAEDGAHRQGRLVTCHEEAASRPSLDVRPKTELSERAKGTSHELWVAWQLQRRGADVIPTGGFASFDLLALADDGRTLRRIEVKAARPRRAPGRYYGEAGRGGVTFARYAGRVEFFVFVAPDQSRAWIMPIEALPPDKTGVPLTDYWLERWDLITDASGVGQKLTNTRG